MWVALIGCKFSPGELGDGGQVAGDLRTADQQIDAPRANCYAEWLAHTIRFGPAVPIAEVNSTMFDRDPFLSPDELSLWVSSGRNQNADDLFIARRSSRTAAFNNPALDGDFNSSAGESKLSITQDGLFAVVGSTQGGSAALDVWEFSRATSNATWSSASRTHMAQVNTQGNDHDPTISGDGLALYVAPDTPAPQHLAVATRATRIDDFGTPAPIADLNLTFGAADPSPTPDERIIVFSSGRNATNGNLWYATRASKTAAWDAPQLVPDINTDTQNEGDGHVSTDGCRIYFSRDLGGDNWDVQTATAL